LDPYRNLKKCNLTRWSGLFIAEGRRVVRRLLASGFPVESVLVSERRRAGIVAQLPPDAPIYIVPQELAEQLVGYNFHAGVLACGRRKEQPDLEAIMSNAGERATLAACPQITDQENLGGIIRVCASFGADGLLLASSCPDPFSRRVLRVSMGNAFRLPIVESRDLAADLNELRSRWGVQLAATALDRDAETLAAASRPPRMALLFGNESEGLHERWLDLCERTVTIPMAPGADSLNVTAAAAVFLHHFTRVA
jgi:tRNA G18 (ribose-2'-O)-methylase SpoU